jgi:ABC-2 type transport system permease protein
LLITVAMGITYTSYRLYLDLQSGIFDRFHSMPIARSAVLWAHVLTSFVANGVSVLLVAVVAFALGFRSDASALGLLAVAGILGLVIIALTWLAVVSGLAAKSVDGASAGLQPIIFLPFISSAFVPTESMPGPVKWFAEHQPMTSIVNAMRDLLTHNVVSNDIWIALGWCMAILIAAYAAALALYRRKIA